MDSFPAFCLGASLLILVVIVVTIRNRNQRLREAETAYRAALEKLRKAPNSSEQREATLVAGRQYARTAHESRRETLFDEIALMNDINAIAGQQVMAPPPGESRASQGKTVEERLTRLRKLAEAGHITEEEYNERRKSVLDEL